MSQVLVQAGCTEFVPSAREAFRELCQSNDVYLITTVSGEEEAERVRAFYEGSGLHDDGLDRRVPPSRDTLSP